MSRGLGDVYKRQVNEVYASFFEGTTYPARCAYQVSALPAGGLVEIETICQK